MKLKYILLIYKKPILFITVLLLSILFSFVYFVTNNSSTDNVPIYAVSNTDHLSPDSWIHSNETTSSHVIINISKSTNFYTEQSSGRQRRVSGSDINVAYQRGTYKGNNFGTIFYQNEELIMRVKDNMNPNDGVIEGYGFFKFDQGKLVFYLFLDEDWRRMANEEIYVVWGSDFSNSETLTEEPFSFEYEEKGVYIHKITTNLDWFLDKNNHPRSRIFFGEIRKQDILIKKLDGTFIYII